MRFGRLGDDGRLHLDRCTDGGVISSNGRHNLLHHVWLDAHPLKVLEAVLAVCRVVPEAAGLVDGRAHVRDRCIVERLVERLGIFVAMSGTGEERQKGEGLGEEHGTYAAA